VCTHIVQVIRLNALGLVIPVSIASPVECLSLVDPPRVTLYFQTL
jgi:hypothetical protein